MPHFDCPACGGHTYHQFEVKSCAHCDRDAIPALQVTNLPAPRPRRLEEDEVRLPRTGPDPDRSI